VRLEAAAARCITLDPPLEEPLLEDFVAPRLAERAEDFEPDLRDDDFLLERPFAEDFLADFLAPVLVDFRAEDFFEPAFVLLAALLVPLFFAPLFFVPLFLAALFLAALFLDPFLEDVLERPLPLVEPPPPPVNPPIISLSMFDLSSVGIIASFKGPRVEPSRLHKATALYQLSSEDGLVS
jgi:hypothetical protein